MAETSPDSTTAIIQGYADSGDFDTMGIAAAAGIGAGDQVVVVEAPVSGGYLADGYYGESLGAGVVSGGPVYTLDTDRDLYVDSDRSLYGGSGLSSARYAGLYDEDIDLGATELITRRGKGGPALKSTTIVTERTEGDMGSESMFDLARELHEIRTEFAHAQGYSSEARTRISRLSAKIKALKEFHATQLTSLRVEYDEKLKAANEREEAIRLLLTDKLEAEQRARERCEREIELLNAQLQDAQGTIQELELAKESAENLLKTTEESYKLQIERYRKQIGQLNDDHNRILTEIRGKNETLRTQITTLTTQLHDARSEKVSVRGVEASIEKPGSETEILRVEKESLERQLEKLTDGHMHDLEALEAKNQHLIAEAVTLREENRSLRSEIQTYRVDHERLQRELRVMQVEKLRMRHLNVGVQVNMGDVYKNVKHSLCQTDRNWDRSATTTETKVVEEVVQRTNQVLVQQAQVQPIQMPYIQQQPQVQVIERVVGGGGDSHVYEELARLREDYEALQRKYGMALAESRSGSSGGASNATSFQASFVGGGGGGTTVVQSGVDERIVHELQEKLFAAERGRLTLMNEFHEKLASREQEFMAKQHQLELRVITLQGEKEREVQARDFKLQSERNEANSIRSDLESRMERVAKERDSLVQEYEVRVANLEKEIDRTKSELSESTKRVSQLKEENITLNETKVSLQTQISSRPAFDATTYVRPVAREAPATTAGGGVDRGAYDRLANENEELVRQVRTKDRQLRDLQEENASLRDKAQRVERLLIAERSRAPSAGGVKEVIKEVIKEVPTYREPSVERKLITPSYEAPEVVVNRAPITVELGSQVNEFKFRAERATREARLLRTRNEELERKYVRAQEIIEELANRSRTADPKLHTEVIRAQRVQAVLQAQIVELKNKLALAGGIKLEIGDESHLTRRVQVLEQQLTDRRDRIAQLERDLDELRMQLTLRDENIAALKKEVEISVSTGQKVLIEKTPSISFNVHAQLSELKNQLDYKTQEAERLRRRALELEIRLSRSQQVVQQLFAIIESTRRNNLKFAQGVMELQMRHLGASGGELQLLSTGGGLVDIIKMGDESRAFAQQQLELLRGPIDISQAGPMRDTSHYDQSISDSESRLKRELERASADQVSMASQLADLKKTQPIMVTAVSATAGTTTVSSSSAGGMTKLSADSGVLTASGPSSSGAQYEYVPE